MTDEQPSNSKSQVYRLAGMGAELGGAIAGFCLLGYWIDRQAGTSPRWLLICAILGLIGGMYNFIRQALRASAAERETKDEVQEPRDR